jgi:glutamate formiminotransferase
MLMECVPNFSEGRNLDRLMLLATSLRNFDVHTLDVQHDHDHNRSVFTYVGDPESMMMSTYAAARTAIQLIDMDLHQGAHPRIGAADVVPLVPLRGVTWAQCIEMAHSLGQRIARDFGVPVYLYGRAALRPERQSMAAIRNRGYETLAQQVGHTPELAPDFGPARLGKAGATCIGVRFPLIAYNVFLNTADMRIANSIARKIRASSGGLAHVQALGFLIQGQAQVSMNLTDFRVTPPLAALEAVRASAATFGAQITHAELVGMIPQAALPAGGLAALLLPPSEDHKILDLAIATATKDSQSLTFA